MVIFEFAKLRNVAICAVVGVVLGLGLGWRLWHPKPAPPETYAPAQRQADGSLVLERTPDASAKPVQIIPKGATVERVVKVTVQPRAIPTNGPIGTSPSIPVTPESQSPQESATNWPNSDSGVTKQAIPTDSLHCPPVTVDLSLVRLRDQTRRVIASSPDGDVIGGVDIPVESVKIPRSLKWAAGGVWNPADRTYGAFLDRDLGPLRVGVEGVQQRAPISVGGTTTWAAQVKLGIRF